MIGFVANEKDVGFGAGGSGFTIHEILSEPILYDMAHFSVISAAKIVKNTGSGGATYDATMYGSNAVYLNGVDQSVDLPIIHDLSTTDTKQTATLGTGWVDNGADSYTATDATSALSALTSSATNNVQITFTISNYTAGDVEGFSADGTYTIDVNDASLDATAFTGDVQIVSVYEITIPTNSYMTYFDVASRSFNQYDNAGIPALTTYNMDKSFQLYFTNTKALTANELAQLNDNPNLLFEVWFNGVTLVDGFSKSDMVDFVPANKGMAGGRFLQNIAYDYGTDVHVDMASSATSGDEVSTYTRISTDSFRLSVTTAGTGTLRPLIVNEKRATYDSGYLLVSFSANVISGTPTISRVSFGATEITNYTIKNGDNAFIVPVKSTIEYLYFDGTSVFDIEISNFKTIPIYVEEIQNYTSACRDTYANVEFGATNFLLQQDASGRPTGVMPVGQIAGSGDGRYIEVPPSLTQYQITSCTDEISGDDDTALTVTPC